MAELVNTQTGELEVIPDSEVINAIQSGGHSFRRDSMVSVAGPSGIGEMRSSDAIEALLTPGSGYRYYGAEEKRQAELEEKFTTPIEQTKALAEGVLRGATLGTYDAAAVATGLSNAEDINARRDFNPATSFIGEAGGTIAPLLATGGTGAVARATRFVGAPVRTLDKVGFAAQKATQKALRGVISGRAANAAALGARGAVEGAGFSAGMYLSDTSLGNEKFNAETLASRLAMGAGFGALLTPVFGISAEAGVRATTKATSSIAKSLRKFAGLDPIAPGVKLDNVTPQTLRQVETPAGRAFLTTIDSAEPGKAIYTDPSKTVIIDIPTYTKAAGLPVLSKFSPQTLKKIEVAFGVEGLTERIINDDPLDITTAIKKIISDDYIAAAGAGANTLSKTQQSLNKQMTGLRRLSKDINNLKIQIADGKTAKTKELVSKQNKYSNLLKGYKRAKANFDKAVQKSEMFESDKQRLAAIDGFIKKNFSGIETGDTLALFNKSALAGEGVMSAFSNKSVGIGILKPGDRAALKMAGLNKGQFTKIPQKRLVEIAEFIKENMRPSGNKSSKFGRVFSDIEDLRQNVAEQKLLAWSNIDASVERATNYLAESRLPTGVGPRDIKRIMLQKSVKEAIDPLTGLPFEGAEATIKFFEKQADALDLMAQRMDISGERFFAPRELYDLRRQYDNVINYRPGKDLTPKEQAAYAMRSIIDDALEESMRKVGDRTGREIFNQYRKGKALYSIAKQTEDLVNGAIAGIMSRSNVGFGGWVGGAGGATAGAMLGTMTGGASLGVLGAAAGSQVGVMAKNFMQGPGRVMSMIYGDKILSTAVSFADKLQSSTQSFLTNSGRARFTPVLTKAFTMTDYARIKKEADEGKLNSDGHIDGFYKNNSGLIELFPKHGYYLQEVLNQGNSFLIEKFPKSNYESFMQSDYEPTRAALAKFDRYYQAVTNPLLILDQYASGDMPVETVEVLNKVYPTIYSAMRQTLLDELPGKKLNYRQKQQIKKVFNLDTSSYHLPGSLELFKALQNPMGEQQQQQQIQRPSGASRVNRAEESMTTSQMLMTR